MALSTSPTLTQAAPAKLTFPEKQQVVGYDPDKLNATEVNNIRNAINQHADVLAALIAQQVPPAVLAFNPQFSGVYSGPRQDGTGASVVTFTRGGVDDFYSAKQTMSTALFPGGIPEPQGAGVPDDYWKLASPPTAPYQSYTVLTPAQLLRVMEDSGVNEWKLYGLLGAQGLVLVYGLTRRYVSYEAWLVVDEDTPPVRGTYDLATDEFVEGVGGGADVSAASVFGVFDNDNGEFYLQVVNGLLLPTIRNGAIVADKLDAEFLASLTADELLRITTTDSTPTVYRAASELVAAINAAPAGSAVCLQVPVNLAQLVVKNGVRYVLGAAATTPQVITDAGQAANCYIEFAQQYTGGRRVAVSNAASQLRIYGGLSGEGESAITASAGTVEHSGQSYSRLANLSGTARLNKWGRHLCGGDTGIIASGSSITHLYGELLAGYERGVELSGSAQVHLHGDSSQTFSAWALAYFAYVAGSAQLHLYAGRHTCAARPYAELQTATAEIHLHPGAELPTPSEGVTIAGIGIVHLYAGCLIDEATIAGTCTIVRHGAASGGNEPYQAANDGTTRYNDVVLTAPKTFAGLSLINASGIKAQVLKTTDNTSWGPERTAAADITADIADAFAGGAASVLVRVEPQRIDTARLAYALFTLS